MSEFSLSLGPRLEMRQELRQEQRLELEQKLEMRLAQQTRLTCDLRQYLVHEDITNSLIKHTDENHRWKGFDQDGFKFAYALVPYALAKPIADQCGAGFAHCQYDTFQNRGKGIWTLFVVEELAPPDFRSIIALHERGEQLSLGNHFFASKLEFGYTIMKGKAASYVRWIDTKYPTKFVDLTQEVLYPILPDELVEYIRENLPERPNELKEAERIIKQHHLPNSVLQKIAEYSERNDELKKTLEDLWGRTQQRLFGTIVLNVRHTPEEYVRELDETMRATFQDMTARDVKIASPLIFHDIYNEFVEAISTDFYKHTKRQILFPSSFEQVHFLARSKKHLPIVSIK